MSFRGRFAVAVSAVTLVTLGGAFTAVSLAVNRAQERQLDAALLAEAREEAREGAALGGDELAISDRPGPAANDVGPLTKYGAIYDADGRVLAATPTFHGAPPRFDALEAARERCFDLWFAGEHLRGVLTPMPGHPTRVLFLAAPRADLDGDEAFLARAMLSVFAVAVAWTAAIATWIVRRLTREHAAIALVARRVAAGDLSARVGSRSRDPEIKQLAGDVDDMIERLGALVTSQQRFIAHAAHELRSPLTTLYGELSHALRRPRDADAYREAIEAALEAARRLKLMAEDLLALARQGTESAEPYEPLDLAEVVHAATESVAWDARERGVLVHEECVGAGRCEGRPRDLERLVRNLIENAVRHSRGGGRVVVTTRARGEHVEVVVADEGPGVADQERERIFEPFYRGATERAGADPGAGLGLAIAREIARAHGGELRLVGGPADGPGATFLLALPARGAEDDGPSATAPRA